MVRDPPRKSAEASRRAVQCSWGQRAQRRRRRKPATCSEWRLRNGRRRQHCFRIHGPQRERIRRLLNAESSSSGYIKSSFIFQRLRMMSSWDEDRQEGTESGRMWQMIQIKKCFRIIDCMANGSLKCNWRLLSNFLTWKMWMENFSANSALGFLQRNGLGQVITEGRETCGRLSILSWIYSIRLAFCSRKFHNTHFAHDFFIITTFVFQ